MLSVMELELELDHRQFLPIIRRCAFFTLIVGMVRCEQWNRGLNFLAVLPLGTCGICGGLAPLTMGRIDWSRIVTVRQTRDQMSLRPKR